MTKFFAWPWLIYLIINRRECSNIYDYMQLLKFLITEWMVGELMFSVNWRTACAWGPLQATPTCAWGSGMAGLHPLSPWGSCNVFAGHSAMQVPQWSFHTGRTACFLKLKTYNVQGNQETSQIYRPKHLFLVYKIVVRWQIIYSALPLLLSFMIGFVWAC